MKVINKAIQSLSLVTVLFKIAVAETRILQDTMRPTRSKVEPFGYQSTKSNGHDVAAAMIAAENPEQGFFLTGTTTGISLSPEAENALHIGMHCYVMQVKPFEKNWVWVKKFGAYKAGVPTGTTCTSIETLPRKDGDTSTKLVVTGYTEGHELFNPEEGLLPFSEIEADDEAKEMETNVINGFVFVLEIDDSLATRKSINSSEIKLIAGKTIASRKVQYPVKVVSVSETDIVVASLVTDDTTPNTLAFMQLGLGQVGDFEPILEYGNFFDVQLQRISLAEDSPVMEKKWLTTFETDDGRGAHVTSLIFDKGEQDVIFGGTTHGTGQTFGKVDENLSNGNDYDGYLTKVDIDTGKFLGNNAKGSAVRIETNPGRDVFVNALCTSGRALYIVGSTNSNIDPTVIETDEEKREINMKLNAFIQKRELDSMKVVWTRQVSTADISGDIVVDDQDVEGLGCAIAHEEEIVYLTGVVHSGASVVDSNPGVGEKDVFVNGYDFLQGDSSERFPLTQIGSSADDLPAKSGGITIDEYGNAVLYGTTKGSLVSAKEVGPTKFAQSYSDIFLMSFLIDSAEHVALVENPQMPIIFRSPGRLRKSVQITLISIFSALGAIIIFLIAYTAGKRRTAEKIEHQQDKDIAKYLEEFEGGRRSASTPSGNGQLYDVSAYYGQNLAVGKDSDKTEPLPGEINLGQAGNTPAASGANDDSKTTYEELMESYKNIQKDLTVDGATPAAGTQFVIDKPNPENDQKIV